MRWFEVPQRSKNDFAISNTPDNNSTNNCVLRVASVPSSGCGPPRGRLRQSWSSIAMNIWKPLVTPVILLCARRARGVPGGRPRRDQNKIPGKIYVGNIEIFPVSQNCLKVVADKIFPLLMVNPVLGIRCFASRFAHASMFMELSANSVRNHPFWFLTGRLIRSHVSSTLEALRWRNIPASRATP